MAYGVNTLFSNKRNNLALNCIICLNTVMALLFEVHTGSPSPIYEQIEIQIRRAVASGALAVGELLPSVRTLAERLTVNPNTVARAYAELTAEGIIESQQGRGFFVAERRQILSSEERSRRLDEAARRFLNETIFLDFSLPELLQRLETLSSEYSKKPPQ
jgi:GntR family transcriptional regulator